MNLKKVAAVIVTYNRSEVVQNTLNCMQLQNYPLSNIIVVDNKSVDNTLEGLQERKMLDNRISVISSPDNLGFGAGLALGVNFILENLNVDFIWLMDDDSFSIPETLGFLVENIEKHQYDALGLEGYKLGLGTKKIVNPKSDIENVDFMLVDHALFRAEMIKIIGPPKNYFFMMCEDYDYCLRIQKAGYKIGVLENKFFERLALGGGERFSQSTSWRGYYHARNHLLILKDYFSYFRMVSYIIVQSKYLIAQLHNWRVEAKKNNLLKSINDFEHDSSLSN